jgi:hypothetical protein
VVPSLYPLPVGQRALVGSDGLPALPPLLIPVRAPARHPSVMNLR